jgi:Mn-dependent DtxR family transcriptional regulator
MSMPARSDMETAVLQTVHAEGPVDLYDLAQAVGTGPRSVQEAVRSLSQDRLVIVSEQGRRVSCTPAGEDLARNQP